MRARTARSASSLASPRRAKTARPVNVHIDDDMITEEARMYAERLVDGSRKTAVPNDCVSDVVGCLRRYKDGLIDDGKYMEAQRVEDIVNELLLLSQKTTFECKQIDDYTGLCEKMRKAQEDLSRAKMIRKNSLSKFDMEHESKLRTARESKTMEVTETMWNRRAGSMRWSPEYLNLRRREQFLVKAKRFYEAHDIKALADRMEVEELREAEENRLASVEKQREHMARRCDAQLECQIERISEERSRMSRQFDAEVERCTAALKFMEKRVRDAGSSNSPGTRKSVRGSFTRISRDELPSRIQKIRVSNYQSAIDRSRLRNDADGQ